VTPPRLAFVGFGTIGRALAVLIRQHLPDASIVGIAKQTPPTSADRALVSETTKFLESPERLAALEVDLVIECAGHRALASYGPPVLENGRSLLLASVGALAYVSLELALLDAAERGGSRILLSTGAVGGLDLLAAARIAGLESVRYTGRKPPAAWLGTVAAAEFPRDIDREITLFDGTAREAALLFPQNANVAATIAFAGLGLDATQVRLVADPAVSANEHSFQAQGVFGSLDFTVRGKAAPQQPKTSMLVAFSLLRALASRQSVVSIT
jgi:aspartate dehydrogenase